MPPYEPQTHTRLSGESRRQEGGQRHQSAADEARPHEARPHIRPWPLGALRATRSIRHGTYTVRMIIDGEALAIQTRLR